MTVIDIISLSYFVTCVTIIYDIALLLLLLFEVNNLLCGA